MQGVTPPTSYIVRNELTSPIFGRAFAQGCGGGFTTKNELLPGDLAMFGTVERWQVLKAAQEQGRDWYYGDHAYMGRGDYYRITKNAYQWQGPWEATPERFERLKLTIAPWRKTGRHIVVAPQSPRFMELFGVPVDAWVADVTRRLRAHTDREIRVRTKLSKDPVAVDLRDAWATVTFSSVVALDGLLVGVPAFVLGEPSAAYAFGSPRLEDIERPNYPDNREALLWTLADHQFTLDDIKRGRAWAVVQ
jgi:hypothetical protein